MAKKKEEVSPVLNAAIMEIVENQLNSGDPPETRKTYDRLVAEGYSDEAARNLIGTVVVYEIYDVLKKKEPFNLARFRSALNRLPNLPSK